MTRWKQIAVAVATFAVLTTALTSCSPTSGGTLGLSCHGNGAKRCPTPVTTSSTSTTTSTTSTSSCVGSALTSQTQVVANTSYCGGTVVGRIVLANGDSWTGGDVSGAVTSSQQGAVQCGSPCALTNMSIHNNPSAFAGVYMPGSGPGPNTVSGGRITGSGSLGIGGSGVSGLTISGVEIDHNGASASCGFEGGGFKGVNVGSRFTGNYVHDNNCMGVWYDISAVNTEIDHNRVDNNADGGIFYEISFNASIHDNEVSGNGSGACSWLWGAGIGVASSGGYNGGDIAVYSNTLSNNCNGVGETQQNRGTSSRNNGVIAVGTPYLLRDVDVYGNSVSASGRTGAVADSGGVTEEQTYGYTGISDPNLKLTWENNTYTNGSTFCGTGC